MLSSLKLFLVEHIISLSTGVCLTIRSATGGDASMNQSAMDVSNASQLMTNLKTNKGKQEIYSLLPFVSCFLLNS